MATSYVGDDPRDVALVDLNNDGKLDVVTANREAATFSVLLGHGNGTLDAPLSFTSGVGLDQIIAFDVNRDGKMDIIGRSFATGSVMVALGNGTGALAAPTRFPGNAPTDMVVVDYNRDGNVDILTIDHGRVSALLGNGDGTFSGGNVIASTLVSSNTLEGGTTLAVGDLNRDGILDIAVGNLTFKDFFRVGAYNAANGIAVMLGNANGTFGAPQISRSFADTTYVDIEIGNFSRGTTADVVAVGKFFEGNGNGGLAQAVPTTLTAATTDVSYQDLNGDGMLDAVFATSTTVGFGYNDGTAAFGYNAPRVSATVAAGTTGVAAGDLNGDGRVDLVLVNGANDTVQTIMNRTSSTIFSQPYLASSEFGAGPAGGGWTDSDRYPRRVGDVNGDGRADIIAFGDYGVTVALGRANGTFAPSMSDIRAFGNHPDYGGATSADRYPRELADVNGDGMDDIVAFGDAGVYVALATGGGHFANPVFAVNAFGTAAGGWTSQDATPRLLGDVNGDGKADIVGFASSGVYVALATTGGQFAAPTFEIAAYGINNSGWTSDTFYPRLLGDVNGDGRADIVGLRTKDSGNYSDVYVSYAAADGGFDSIQLTGRLFGHGNMPIDWHQGLIYPRTLGDVNGDGRADIIGFGENSLVLQLAETGAQTGNRPFQAAILDAQIFSHAPNSGGLSDDSKYPRFAADVDGDGYTDLIGIGDNGVYVSLGGPMFML